MDSNTALDGRLELKGLLGMGGMGEVHRAWDRGLERAVAVKFFRGAEAREAERLLLEGRLQARVDHPHVVRVYDAGSLQGRACLVLQLVEGRSLADLAPQLTLEARVELLRQAALGVHAAHLQGLVHRDVKPGNVLVEQGPGAPRALVSDFGLARAEEPGLTRSGLFAGTLAFMSPEQMLGEGPVGFAADVYGLGATLYAALSGRPPRDASPSPPSPESPPQSPKLLRQIADEPPPLPPEVPKPLARVVAKAMERAPGARYESAEALAEDLARYQRGEPVKARRPPWPERALSWSRRNRGAARAMAIAAAAVLVSLGWGLWSARRASAQALEAARLGALGESMEAELRMEYLSPPHDLRPALARLRAQVEALRPEAARGGGPASFALGKGLELLGDVEGARAAYERAWQAGFQTPRVAEGLGNSFAAQYRQAHQRALETLEPAAREARVGALRAELRDPAIRYLTLAGAEGWRTAFLRASIALLEGDHPAARARADEVLSLAPGRYEALTLKAQAHLEESFQQSTDGHLDSALTEAGRASEILREAARWGRSDPSVAKAAARARVRRVAALAIRGEGSAEELAAAFEAIERAAALLTDDPELLEIQADLLVQRQRQTSLAQSPAEMLQSSRETAEIYRKALQLDPSSVRLLCGLGRALHGVAYALLIQGADPQVAVEEGLSALERAGARAPSDPEVHRVRSSLRSDEARYLVNTEKPAGRALRQWAEAGEEALRLGVRGAADMKALIGEARLELGVETWKSGGDPRPEIARGVALLEEGMQSSPGRVSVAMNAALGHAEAGDALMAMGEDGWTHFSRARELLGALEAAHPKLASIQVTLVQVLLAEALHRVNAGIDPSAEAAEIRKRIDSAAREPRDHIVIDVHLASLRLIEARWERTQGRDPTGLLGRAERELEEVIQRHPDESNAWEYLATVGLERALWDRRLGLEPAPAARKALEALKRPLDQGAREPGVWALRARLLALAGDREQAKQSLERSLAINPLARGGHDYREASAELAR
jgi:tetratricopeptide (TPR) repeat protein